MFTSTHPGAGPSAPTQRAVTAPNDLILFDPVPSRLLRSRIVVLGSEVTDETANTLVGQMLLLAADNSEADVTMVINSPGGSVSAGMAIYDAMNFIPCDVRTITMGLAASMGQFLLTAGTPGKRFALPHAKIMMHQPLGGIGGSASDIKIQAEQMSHTKRLLASLIAKHSGQPLEQIALDSERDRWFTAEEAAEYGLVDRVVTSASEIGVLP